jgi:hypothetical protein
MNLMSIAFKRQMKTLYWLHLLPQGEYSYEQHFQWIPIAES